MKFLRGKVWQIVLALCMLVVLLCITASAAESGTASFKIGSNTYTINQADESALYFTTTESGVPTALNGEVYEMESTYKIKAVFPDDDGETEGVPTIYLRGAFLTQSIASVSNTETLARIVVEDVDGFDVAVDENTTANAYIGASISWPHSDLEICGPGRLYATKAIGTGTAAKQLIYKNADVILRTGTTSGATALGVTFDGGRFDFESAGSFLSYWSGDARSITVTNNAHVTLTSTEKPVFILPANSLLTVNSGYIRMANTGVGTSEGDGNTFRGGLSMKINGGTVEASGYEWLVYGSSGTVPVDLSEYASYSAVYSNSSAGTTVWEFDAANLSRIYKQVRSMKYFKVEPKYTTTVSGGTASPAAGVANTEVTLMATPAANQTFLNWTVKDGPEGFDISDLANPSAETTTFTMPAGNVSIKAEYETEATILLGELSEEQCTFSNITPKYFTTDSSTGAVTPIKTPANGTSYNIKLAFNGDVPTVYLKGAYIKVTGTTHAIENSTGAANFAIVTEVTDTKIDTASDLDTTINLGTNDGRNDRYVDSYIDHEDGSAVRLSLEGGVTFSGIGLLKTYDSTETGKSIDSTKDANVTFNNANVAAFHASVKWGSNNFAMNGVGTVTTIGGKVSIYTKYIVYYSDYSHLVVEDGADLSFISSNIVAYEFGDLTVNGGRLYVKADGTGSEVFKGANSITVNGGEMEVSCGKAVTTVGISSLYNGSYAVMGASKANAEPYTAGSALAAKYFHIGKKATVNVTSGTAKVYQASGAQIDAIVGDTVTLTPDAATGEQVFIGWTFDEGSPTPAIANNTFKMPDGAVSVTANYGKQASVTIAGTPRSVFQGYDALYFTTTDGTVALGGDERTYNIKFVYPAGDGATPKLYLRGAYLTQAIASNDNTVAGTAIIVEKVGNYPSTVPDSAVEKGEAKPDSYITVGISWTNMALTIQGYEGNNKNPALADMGKLKMTLTAGKIANVGSAYKLTFKDLDLTATTTAVSLPSSVTFDGGKASITSTTAVYQIWPSTTDTTSTGVRVTGGADVSLVGVGNTICIYNSTSSKVIIEKDSKLKVVSSNAREPLRADDKYNGGMHDVLQVKGGTLEAISNGSTAGFGTTYARMSGYDDTFFAINGTSVTDSAEIQLSKYSYFKVEPAYTISVSNGTASFATDLVTVDNATIAPVGATVTLTPAAKSGHRFYKWTYGQNSQKPPITNNAFTMPKGTVSVEANYDEIKTIKILGTAYDFTVHEPLYFTTVDGAVEPLTKGDLEKLYNIKLAVDDEGVPTVYLKGATITTGAGVHAISNGAGISNLVVVVKSESTITSGGRGFYLLNSNMTITGPGKLSILTQGGEYSYGSGIVFENNTKEGKYELTFDDANVLVDAGGKDTSAIFEIRRDIDVIIDGGTVELKSVFHNWNSYTYKTDNVPNEGEDANGKNNVPQIKGDWTAIQGDSTTYWGYSSGTLLDQRYFKVEPKVVEVTITWGAMSFTYTGSIWNVETHQWEGRWEPTVSDDSEAAGMVGYDSALASNQIKVVNSGTVTVNVSFRFNPDANFGSDYGTVNGAFVTRKPYYFSNWDPVDSSEFPYIWSKAYFGATRNGTEVTVSYKGETSISGMAAKLKEVFDQYPENANMRIINITAVARSFLSEQTENYVFMESGVVALADWVDKFLTEYERIDGKLDAIYSDLEYNGGYAWYLFSDHYNNDETDVFYKITQHSSYPKIRRELEERGFEFYSTPADASDADKREKCELYTLVGSSSANEKSRYTWDAVVRDLLCDYLDEAIYKPLQEHYPNAYFTDYQSRDTYGWMKLMNENAYNTYLGGNTQKAGTHSSYNAYNYAPQWVTTKSETDTSYKKPVSYNGAVFEDNAFHMTQWETNNFKAMYAATDSKKIEITLTYYDYAIKMREEWRDNQDATSSGTPYHIEGYLHAGLLDPEFGGYVIESEVENETYPSSTGSYSDALGIISNIMKTLDAVVGYSDRKPIETPLNWNDSFILSGMYANGRNVWRITPDTVTGVSKGEFLDNTEGGQIVFKNKGQTITFPQGSIIEEPVDISVGTCGYWVETPADVMPIVTNVENRYEQYPAYVETFDNDNYTVGEAFSSQHSHTWELGDSSVTIQQNGDDKFLAIQGNATLNNVKLPEYITAGDNYAKQQAWELSFKLDTLPTGDAEVILLSAASDSGSNTDGGFRVYNNGQLDYSTASGYQAFNITLDANTEYTVKRVFNFRTANSFTCSYYVYAADGSELAKAEDVVISSLSLPVQKIGISTANFDTNTLYVDDYKLYATGVTTDLEVYNADTGIQVNASVLREDNTAYRLSWMNASDAIKYYNVVATYEDGTKEIVKSIKMLPGCDGVNTGIVKVDDGKSVTISLEETDTKVPDAGDNAGDDGSSNGSNSANGEDTTITLTRSQEADAYLYLSSGYVAVFDERKTLGTVTVTINAITPAQEGGNA